MFNLLLNNRQVRVASLRVKRQMEKQISAVCHLDLSGELASAPWLSSLRSGSPAQLRWQNQAMEPAWQVVDVAEMTSAGCLPVRVTTVADAEQNQPRRRVHQVDSLLALAKRLKGVRLYEALANRFDRIKLKDPETCSIIQDGISDRHLLERLLNEYARLEPEASARHVLATGGAVNEVLPAWTNAAAYRRFEPESRQLRLNEDDGLAPPCVASAARERLHRSFTPAQWQAWVTQPFPGFVGGELITCIEDEFVEAVGHACWHTTLYSGQTWPERSMLAQPWLGVGRVTRTDSQEPWLEAELEGFAAPENSVRARLLTPTSGEDASSGLHLLPTVGTVIALFWTGRFNEAMWTPGNLRRAKVSYPAPALQLRSDFNVWLNQVLVKHIGTVQIQGDLSIQVEHVLRAIADDCLEAGTNQAGLTINSEVNTR